MRNEHRNEAVILGTTIRDFIIIYEWIFFYKGFTLKTNSFQIPLFTQYSLSSRISIWYKTLHGWHKRCIIDIKKKELTRKIIKTTVQLSTQPLNNEMKTALFFVNMMFATWRERIKHSKNVIIYWKFCMIKTNKFFLFLNLVPYRFLQLYLTLVFSFSQKLRF